MSGAVRSSTASGFSRPGRPLFCGPEETALPFCGPNGLGGVTVSGSTSDYRQSVDKKGNIRVSMNVIGTGISAQVYINLPNGGNQASVDISPNLNSDRKSVV